LLVCPVGGHFPPVACKRHEIQSVGDSGGVDSDPTYPRSTIYIFAQIASCKRNLARPMAGPAEACMRASRGHKWEGWIVRAPHIEMQRPSSRTGAFRRCSARASLLAAASYSQSHMESTTGAPHQANESFVFSNASRPMSPATPAHRSEMRDPSRP
jgi:hypothetical protein